MDKLTYEQRVQIEYGFLSEDNSTEEDIYYKDAIMIASRIVDKQAEAIREYHHELIIGDSEDDVDAWLLENGYVPAPEVKPSEPDGIGCVFCGVTPMVFRGTCCATCGKSYRHG